MHASSPNSDDETVILRRVHKHHSELGEPIKILPVAFRPNPHDTSGISVSFDEHSGGISPSALASQNGKSPEDYCVVAFQLSDLKELGLSVVSDEPPPGHALIREINWVDYDSKEHKPKLKKLLLKLAKLASDAIVFPTK